LPVPRCCGKPDALAARLAYGSRDLEQELALIDLVRKQMGCILRALAPEDFRRRGIHDKRGPMTLADLVERVTGHIGSYASGMTKVSGDVISPRSNVLLFIRLAPCGNVQPPKQLGLGYLRSTLQYGQGRRRRLRVSQGANLPDWRRPSEVID
jgi:hypothetical protein